MTMYVTGKDKTNEIDDIGNAKSHFRIQRLGLQNERILGYFCRSISLLWRLFQGAGLCNVLASGAWTSFLLISPFLLSPPLFVNKTFKWYQHRALN